MAEGVVDLLLQGILIICTTKDCVAHFVRIPGVILTGLKFWKSPRRKVFAVRKSSVKSRGKKRSFDDFLSESDDDPTPKRGKSVLPHTVECMVDDVKDDVLRTESKVEDLKEELVTVKSALTEVLHLSSSSKVPIALQRLIKDAFQCKICLSAPITPPVVMSKCCKCIIGCEHCINQWYSGEEALTKRCPNCRAERGYSSTMLLRGLDSFLTETKGVFQLPPVSPAARDE